MLEESGVVDRLWGVLVLCLACVASLAACQSHASRTDAVTVSGGRVAGESDGDVAAFKGIPYAAAPVGPLRWRPPQPVEPWEGVHDATEFAAACPQPKRNDRRRGIGRTSEDCLYLNVWAPVGAHDAPVMVWIHGGAFRIGSASQSIYDGSRFAADGIVLVSFDYRLGRLGFFAHPSLESGGNFGLMDQAAALEWVRDNIAAFGGDPENVTVFGESAGGASVLHLLTSPKAAGLFDKAVIESGGGLQVDGHLTEQRGRKPSLVDQGLAWKDRSVTAAELRAMPVGRVVGDTIGGGVGSVGPVIDGTWVPDDPGRRLLRGEFNRVPVMVGANSNEASVLRAFGTSAEQAVRLAGVTHERLRDLYPGENWAAEAWGDGAFVSGARLIARSVADAGEPAYLYHFDYVLARRRGKVPGAGHGTEIPFVFQTLGEIPLSRILVRDEDRAMADRMHRYWLSFARSGRPDGSEWPAYTPDNDTLLYLGEQVEPRSGFRSRQLDFHEALWRVR